MIHTHQTAVPGLLMNVDQVLKKDDHYYLNGWIGSTTNTVSDILIDGISLSPTFYKRTDVIEYYPVIGDLLGFELELPFDKMNLEVEDILGNDNIQYATGVKFNQWIVYKYGYGQ